MSTEWSVSFEFKMTGVVADWSSIIHLTIGGDAEIIGDRTPAVFLMPESRGFHFTTSLGDDISYFWDYYENLQQNYVYEIEIHQRYISNGNYRYFIKIDREEVHSAINSKARQFYNVKVYVGDPWYNASKGLISNLQFTNFL